MVRCFQLAGTARLIAELLLIPSRSAKVYGLGVSKDPKCACAQPAIVSHWRTATAEQQLTETILSNHAPIVEISALTKPRIACVFTNLRLERQLRSKVNRCEADQEQNAEDHQKGERGGGL